MAETGAADLDVQGLVHEVGLATRQPLQLSLQEVGARLPDVLAEGHGVVADLGVVALLADLVGGTQRSDDEGLDFGLLQLGRDVIAHRCARL
jgi:hypothetical protein